ncbi:hypothetical protein Plhal304r1_c089g0170731 [Plasmopara halstedii]
MKSSPKTCSFPHATILALCLSIPPCALVLVLSSIQYFHVFCLHHWFPRAVLL